MQPAMTVSMRFDTANL